MESRNARYSGIQTTAREGYAGGAVVLGNFTARTNYTKLHASTKWNQNEMQHRLRPTTHFRFVGIFYRFFRAASRQPSTALVGRRKCHVFSSTVYFLGSHRELERLYCGIRTCSCFVTRLLLPVPVRNWIMLLCNTRKSITPRIMIFISYCVVQIFIFDVFLSSELVSF